jgi:hypothetical protein
MSPRLAWANRNTAELILDRVAAARSLQAGCERESEAWEDSRHSSEAGVCAGWT